MVWQSRCDPPGAGWATASPAAPIVRATHRSANKERAVDMVKRPQDPWRESATSIGEDIAACNVPRSVWFRWPPGCASWATPGYSRPRDHARVIEGVAGRSGRARQDRAGSLARAISFARAALARVSGRRGWGTA